MRRQRRRPRLDSTRFASLVNQAGHEIAEGLRNAALISDHHPSSGTIRENGFREFLRKVLPSSYFVGTGFAFDAYDTQTRQLDIIIALDPPLVRVLERDGLCYLPCEAVLAVIEVKKTLSAAELGRSLTNAASVRSLRPYGRERFGSVPPRGKRSPGPEHRCFYNVAAFSSDLVLTDWAQAEWDRYRRLAAVADQPVDIIDRLVILDRGLVNTVDALAEDGTEAMDFAMLTWFVHLSNFLDRESGRRPPIDIDIYTRNRPWKQLMGDDG